MSRAAFFDLDRTLLRVNSGPLYVRWRVRQGRMGVTDMARASWWAFLYSFGILDVEGVSRQVMRMLRGVDEATFRAECAEWVAREVLAEVTDAAHREVERRRSEGFVCALLTTSSPYIAEPVAAHVGVEHVLSSRMSVRDGLFTGEVEQPLCYGAGKVEHARRWAREHGVSVGDSVFYTDSISDLPMLEQVKEPRVINPDPLLLREARRRGWTIESWV